MELNDSLTVKKISYRIIRLLGKGKGGYSYLAERDGQQVVVKQIHHEPCDYYTFGNKIEAELRDYERLQKAGIRIPGMCARYLCFMLSADALCVIHLSLGIKARRDGSWPEQQKYEGGEMIQTV